MTTEPVPAPEQKPETTPHHKRNLPWGGLILIVLGIVFLLQQLGRLSEHFNWWALFILIPAFSSFAAAWQASRSSGRFNAAARSAFGSGVVVLTVAILFLFDLNWTVYWPVMVIVAGFSMLIGSFPDKSMDNKLNLKRFMSMGLWFGLGGILIGTAFLLKNLGIYDIRNLLGERWYGYFIFIPGIGFIVNAILLYIANDKKPNMAFRAMLGMGLLIIIFAGLMVGGLAWPMLGPVLIMGAGLAFIISAFIK